MKAIFLLGVVFTGLSNAIIQNSVSGWTIPSSGQPYYLVNENLYQCTVIGSFDFGYATQYEGTQPEPTKRSEKYGFNIYSLLEGQFAMNFLNIYMWNCRFRFNPFYIEPYNQYVIWDSPLSGSFHLYLQGTRNIKFLDFTTLITENTYVIKKSLEEAFDPSTNLIPDAQDKYLEEDYENRYKDAFWKFNVFDILGQDTSSWQGSQTYYGPVKLF
ncbi:UNKNOWN [Stylonychia lemnae]|uniref:Uncharacterized protein n=1 Tax=Stylonychia lemnae TaxID=5949 RepID=A0A078AHC6_STYLE|nr:UNKNOWN [Stylonychia lemnae]|eukprot:CDW80243.1 UNKNOWN [Stylonychia lemnae]